MDEKKMLRNIALSADLCIGDNTGESGICKGCECRIPYSSGNGYWCSGNGCDWWKSICQAVIWHEETKK